MKNLLYNMISVVLVATLLVGCGPSAAELAQQATQTAAELAAIQTAEAPTATATFIPTSTPTFTPTSTATFTPTPTNTITPTPMNQPPLATMAGETWIRPVDGMVMAYIQEGKFLMGTIENVNNTIQGIFASGDESPQHEVYLDAFWMDETEVTNDMYRKCVESGDCSKPTCEYYESSSLGDHPVVCVNWNQAAEYCEWVGGSLPTEAQWEKAARGNLEGKVYPWGDEWPECEKGVKNGANFADCGGGTAPVASFSANNYGLFDVAGNVWEWVSDWYGSDFYCMGPNSNTSEPWNYCGNASPYLSTWQNPQGPENGSLKVYRGGAWNWPFLGMSTSNRNAGKPESLNNDLGFRCSFPQSK